MAVWVMIFLLVLLWSAWRPHDFYTWALEVSPAVAGFFILAGTRRRFPLTTILYVLVLIHAVILMIGGHYTYAEVPLGEWFRDLTGGSRNNYDKLGHFAQGFVPAVLAREVLIRLGVIRSRAWLGFIVVAICLAFSAFYELLEWWVALLSDEAAESFLGTQGYVWDTQSDMFLALIGAIVALLTLGGLHDRQLSRLPGAPGDWQI